MTDNHLLGSLDLFDKICCAEEMSGFHARDHQRQWIGAIRVISYLLCHHRVRRLSTSRLPALAAVAALLFFAVTPCAHSAPPLRLALSLTPLCLPIFVAQSQGYFAAEGLLLDVSEVIGGYRSLQEVLDGNADLATSSEAVVMFNSFERDDYAVIATFVTSDKDIQLVTRASAGIAGVPQLAGKRVATVVGSASHYYLYTSLVLHGIDPKTVQIRNVPPEAMSDALQNGDVDAIAIWTPYPFQVLAKLPDAKVLPDSTGYIGSFNLVASRRVLGERDDDLVKLLRALDRAQQFIAAEPDAAKAVLRDRLRMEAAPIESLWSRYNYRLTLSQSLLSTLEGEARWARQEGYAQRDQSPNYLDFIYSEPLRRVQPTAVGIAE